MAITAKDVKYELAAYYRRRNPAWGMIEELGYEIKHENGKYSHSRVIDAVAWRENVSKFGVDVIEVKVARSDWLAELKSEKWRDTFELGQRFWFAAPPGIIKKDEVPDECGLYVVNRASNCPVRVMKQAKSFARPVKQKLLIKLLLKMRRSMVAAQHSDLDARQAAEPTIIKRWSEQQKQQEVTIRGLREQIAANPNLSPEKFISVDEFRKVLQLPTYRSVFTKDKQRKQETLAALTRLGRLAKFDVARLQDTLVSFENVIAGLQELDKVLRGPKKLKRRKLAASNNKEKLDEV